MKEVEVNYEDGFSMQEDILFLKSKVKELIEILENRGIEA